VPDSLGTAEKVLTFPEPPTLFGKFMVSLAKAETMRRPERTIFEIIVLF